MPRRPSNQLRPIRIVPHYLDHPEGSALVSFGDTRVLCTASVEERLPRWLTGSGKGWVTAEYDMLPRATNTRRPRDSHRGKINGRTQEISRLIGRSLRAVVDLKAMADVSITVDCDVIQADGGTRTAAITGGYVALALALKHLEEEGKVKNDVLKGQVAAISVGMVHGESMLDLDYSLDSIAEVDMNVVMTDDQKLVEVQGTGEGATFDRTELNQMMDLAYEALPHLVELQHRALSTPRQALKTPIEC